MSVPVNLRQLPAHVKQSAYFPARSSAQTSTSTTPWQQHQRLENKTTRPGLVPLSFPATNIALWDKTPTGTGTTLHISQERNLHIHILERTLRLAYRHAAQHQSSDGKTKAFLLAQAFTNADDDGVTVTVDRFDPGHEIPGKPGMWRPTAKLPGDHVIPLSIVVNKEFDSTTHTEDDFRNTFQLLQHHCCSRESVDVANLVSLRIHCCCYANDDDITFSIHVAGVTIATSLDLVPISPIPVIPTALARNLVGPLNLSEVQGNPKSGFVTLDQTRKLLLLLESDPKAYSLPLVGIWLSGISYIGSPIIWATCLRYLFNSSIQERVCSATDGFLVILYSPNKRKPDFYQCTASSRAGEDGLRFQLVGCRENLHVFKHANVTNQAPMQLELRPARDGPNKSVFLEACKQFKPLSWKINRTATGGKQASKRPNLRNSRLSEADEDIQMMPRPSPKPIMEKSPTVRPSVPELSLIFDNFDEPHPHSLTSSANQLDNDEVFMPQNAHKQKRQQYRPHHQQKENPHPQPISKTGHLIQSGTRQHKSRQRRPGPLRDIDQNSPHGVGKRTSSANGGKTVLDESQPRQQVGPRLEKPVKPNIQQCNSQTTRTSEKRLDGPGRVYMNHQQNDVANYNTSPLIGQGSPSSHASTNQGNQHAHVVENSNRAHGDQHLMNPTHRLDMVQNNTNHGNMVVPGQRRTSAPTPYQNAPGNIVIANEDKRQSLPHGAVPQHQGQSASNNQPHHGSNNRHLMAGPVPQSISPHCQQPVIQGIHRTNSNTLQHVQTMDVLQEDGTSTARRDITLNNSTPTALRSAQPVPLVNYSESSESMTNSLPGHSSQQVPPYSSSPYPPSTMSERTSTHSTQNYPNHSMSNPSSTISPTRQTGNPNCLHQMGLDNLSEQHQPMQSLPNASVTVNHQARVSPSRQTGNPSCQHQRGSDNLPVSGGSTGHGGEGGNSSAGNLASGDAYEQLKRQEQMIRELQDQIQMLLHVQAQQATSSVPSGVMTPPATPTSNPSSNQAASTPVNHKDTPPKADFSANCSAPMPVSHHSPSTRLVSAATSSAQQCDVGCSIGVNTGQSLLWTPGTKSRKSPERGLSSERKDMSSKHQRSPPHPHPAAKDAGNSTFDIDSEPNMSIDVEGARDETHSGISMIGPIEMNSSLDTNSRTSSPKQSPNRHGNNETSHLSDSFRSPVLGESASTCRPPGRPLVSSDSEEEDGVQTGVSGGAPSLLYRDERKFYDNILGNVKQLLNDPTAPDQKHPTSSSSSDDSSDSSTSDDSSSEDSEEESDVTIATCEEEGLLGLKLTLPEDFESGTVERSILHRSIYNASPDFFPRINYVSLMDFTLDSPNLSMEANALAMKYLSDEELAKLSVGFKSTTAATPRNDVNPLLRTALVGSRMVDRSMVGISSVGFPASVDMSMASRKYMEKYGLIELENNEGKVNLGEKKSPKKKGKNKKKKKSKTNKDSKVVDIVQERTNDRYVNALSPLQEIDNKSETASPTFDPQYTKDDRIRATPTLHPNSNQVSPVSEGANKSYEPWLKRPPKKLQEHVNTGAFKAFDKGQVKDQKVKGQDRLRPVGNGNILDISRLQELPKLL